MPPPLFTSAARYSRGAFGGTDTTGFFFFCLAFLGDDLEEDGLAAFFLPSSFLGSFSLASANAMDARRLERSKSCAWLYVRACEYALTRACTGVRA